jgi:membrane protease YdiL (CAAX protease family)
LLLLSILPLLAAYYHQPSRWRETLWLFAGAGFGEEIFFRGYIQSRLDHAFGCSVCVWGVRSGVGLLASSLLFGFIHALNTVDYFHACFDFGWSYGLQAMVQGLLYGILRAKSGSVLPGAITHGLLDAFSRIPKLLPGT